MAKIRLGNHCIDSTDRDYYLIAEVGVNHENSLEKAKLMIEQAYEGGAQAVKFQTYKAEKLASKHSPAYWDIEKENTKSQFALFQKYDSFGTNEYACLKDFAIKIGIDFLSTAFDNDSLKMIEPLVEFHKVASADITNIPLIRAIGSTKKPIVLSTGAASFVEIQAAVEQLRLSGSGQIALLHCVLNYPTLDQDAYLGRIQQLKHFFPDFVVGYSDHTLPTRGCFSVAISYALGARIFEKHFTFDKNLPGNDHYHSMDLADLRNLVTQLNQVKGLLGSGNEQEFLKNQLSAIENARRSVVSTTLIKKGTIISEEHIIPKRPGHGISPLQWDAIVGKVATRDINEDSIISWSDIS